MKENKNQSNKLILANYMQLLFIFTEMLFFALGSFTKEIFIMSIIVNFMLGIIAVENSLRIK